MLKMRIILRVVLNIVMAFLVIFGLVIVITLLPIKGNIKLFAVMSGSMKPKIPVGSLIIVRPEKQYKTGEIITFKPVDAKSERDFVTHRIVSISEVKDVTYCTTKGDANDAPDTTSITANRIIGKELFEIPIFGYLFGYIKTLPGLLLIIIVPSAIIVYEEVKKIHREAKELLRKKREKKREVNNKPALQNKPKRKGGKNAEDN